MHCASELVLREQAVWPFEATVTELMEAVPLLALRAQARSAYANQRMRRPGLPGRVAVRLFFERAWTAGGDSAKDLAGGSIATTRRTHIVAAK